MCRNAGPMNADNVVSGDAVSVRGGRSWDVPVSPEPPEEGAWLSRCNAALSGFRSTKLGAETVVHFGVSVSIIPPGTEFPVSHNQS